MRVVASLGCRSSGLLAAFVFRRLWLLRIVQLIGAIRCGLFFGLFSESFVFELSNLGLGLIEFGLQLDISFDGVGVPALPIAHFATQCRVLTSQRRVLTSQFADFLPQLLDKSCQRLQLFVN